MSTSAPAYLQFRAVEKRYGPVRALAGIDLSVPQGAIMALLGPNGAGKSTLFSCLLGLTRLTAGEVLVRDKAVAVRDRARFGYSPERIALYQQQTVWENALYFSQLRAQPKSDLSRQLERVGLFTLRERKVGQLSKGMLQRLGLAIALCGAPELLVLDEPFNGLDPVLLDDLRGILREEHQRGATLLISTHTMSAIEPLATHVAILLGGRLATSGARQDLSPTSAAHGSLELVYQRIAREQVREDALV